jgi:hypothetical protein
MRERWLVDRDLLRSAQAELDREFELAEAVRRWRAMGRPVRAATRRRLLRVRRARRAMQAPRRRGRVLYLHPGAEGNEHGRSTLVIPVGKPDG